MSEYSKKKAARLNEILDEVTTLTADVEGDEAKNTPDNREKITSLLTEGETLRKSIEQDNMILGLKGFINEPAHISPTGGDGVISQPFQGRIKSLGEQFIESNSYKSAIDGGTVPAGMRASVETRGFITSPSQAKATFTTAATGLETGLPYVGGMVEIEQQRLYVRDLLSVGQTTLNSIPYIVETSFTNAAAMVPEEGLKPEATFATDDRTAPVKKIAVIGRVTDEMFADFPMMRDYVNNRLRFMVLAREEQQLLNGTGIGNNITGILQTSGIQTQAKGADSNFDAVHKAITKVRSVGFFEPDGIVMHPTDYQILRLAKDLNNQYYGGGPMTGAYGNGGVAEMPAVWGLRPVVTTAIAAGTALVGAFKLGAQVWQREGITVESTNTDGEDFRYNRVAIRVEERLALTVYRPLAFCSVTGIVA